MTTVSEITTRPISGLAHIDALIGDAQPWNYLGRNVLNFSFSASEGAELSNAGVNLATRSEFNDVQKAQARTALDYLSQLTGIRFAEVSGGAAADIQFANADLLNEYTGLASNAMSYTSLGDQVTGLNVDSWVYLDVVDDVYSNLAPMPGTIGYETLLHELGHALGLKHPFEGAQQLAAGSGLGHDNTLTTLMSYTEIGAPHTTFSPYDLAALDWLYGGDGLGGRYGIGAAGLLLTGTVAADTLNAGGSGNDTLTGLGGNDALDGSRGTDTAVFSGVRADYTVTGTSTGVTVTHRTGGDGTDTLVNIERLQFSNTNVAIDVAGHGGQAYRLYQAAFNRTPDVAGLGYQMNALDTGMALSQVAQNFLDSPEFSATYGGLDTGQFVTQLYANVLHRAPDTGGFAFHIGNLSSGANTRADVLVGFSESPENQVALIGTIQNGMAYTL